MMRRLAVAVAACLTSGCSIVLADLGRHQSVVHDGTPRDSLLAELGPPLWTCRTDPLEEGPAFLDDYFTVFGKYPDSVQGAAYADVDVGTLLVGEAIAFPMELIRSAVKAVTPGGLHVGYMTPSQASGEPPVPRVFRYETHWSTTGEAVKAKACKRKVPGGP